MVCCFNCDRCDGCCKRLGCGCKDHEKEGRLDTISGINRSCTDLPCIVLFAVFILTMTSYVWSTAFSEGDPDRLIRGVNHSGKICGKSEGVELLPYAFWPDLTEFRFKVCTDDCNKATFVDWESNHIRVPDPTSDGAVIEQAYESEVYLDRYCVPSLDSLSIDGFDDDENSAARSVGDIDLAMPVFGISIGVAFVMAFGYVWLMKCCVGVLVWGIVAAILVCGTALGYLLFNSKDDANLTDKEQSMRMYSGIVILVATFIFFCIIVFARKRIMIAIQVIKSAGRAFGDMPMMVFFPIGPIFGAIGFFWAWVYAAVYIFSAGEVAEKDTPTHFIGKSFVASALV